MGLFRSHRYADGDRIEVAGAPVLLKVSPGALGLVPAAAGSWLWGRRRGRPYPLLLAPCLGPVRGHELRRRPRVRPLDRGQPFAEVLGRPARSRRPGTPAPRLAARARG